MATDYGTPSATYEPDANANAGGLIGKIAVQLIEGEGFESEYGALFKEPMQTGKDLEVAVYLAATGVDYSATDAPEVPFPSAKVLYFKSNVKRTYPVKIDRKDVDEVATNTGAADRIAEEIVQTLYSGAFKEENANIMAMLTSATTAGGTTSQQLVDGGSYTPAEDETTAKALLSQIKNTAKRIKRGATSVNPRGLSVRAPRVVMFIPVEMATAIDVYARLGNENESVFARYDIDEVFEYVPTDETAANNAIYICDDRWFQIRHVHADSYKQAEKAGTDNIDAFLHRYIQYAACPLFGGVKLSQSAGA